LLLAAHGLATAHALLCIVNGDDSAIFHFFVHGDLDLWPLTLTFELGRDFCTVYLIAKSHHPAFSLSEVIVQTNTSTNKETPLKTSTALRYATPVGKYNVIDILYKRVWFISALCSLFSNWPGNSRVRVLSCELKGQDSRREWDIFLQLHFTFNLIMVFSWVG